MPELVLDVVLGYSQHGPPRGEAATLIEWCGGRRVLALDVPLGLELETGIVHTPCVRAEFTLTLALPKRGLRSGQAAAVVGELLLADLSVPAIVYERAAAAHPSPFGLAPIVQLTAAPRQGR